LLTSLLVECWPKINDPSSILNLSSEKYSIILVYSVLMCLHFQVFLNIKSSILNALIINILVLIVKDKLLIRRVSKSLMIQLD